MAALGSSDVLSGIDLLINPKKRGSKGSQNRSRSGSDASSVVSSESSRGGGRFKVFDATVPPDNMVRTRSMEDAHHSIPPVGSSKPFDTLSDDYSMPIARNNFQQSMPPPSPSHLVSAPISISRVSMR